MATRTKARSTGFIINKTGENQRFQNYLQMVSGTHQHFATTLNQNPHLFMSIYNEHHMDNSAVSAEQEALGLNNNVKLGISTLFFLAAEHYHEPGLASYDLADEFINYQLPLLQQAGLRFIEDEKTVLMAAVWYNWVTSSRTQDGIASDLCQSFYDIFWLFLQPTEQARAIDFDRDSFTQAMETSVNSRIKSKPALAPVDQATPFGTAVQNVQRQWFAAAKASNPQLTEEGFGQYLQQGVQYFKSVRSIPSAEVWDKACNAAKVNMTSTGYFEDRKALIASYVGAVMLPQFTDLHSKILTIQFMEDMANQVASRFYMHGYKLAFNVPGTAQEMAELSVFHFWTALNDHAAHIKQGPTTAGELHLKIGAELALIAENLVFTLLNFFEPAGPEARAKSEVVNDAVINVLGYLVTEAAKIHPQFNPPEQSIFNIGAASFYNNLSLIIEKETNMSNASKTAAANAKNAGTSADPTVVMTAAPSAAAAGNTEMDALIALMNTNLEAAVSTAMTAAAKDIGEQLEKTFKKEINGLQKRLEAVEQVVDQTADKSKLNDAGKAKLKEIGKAADDAVKAAKKKSSKKSVTGVQELTLTEKVVVGVGVGALTGAVVYGAVKLGEFLMGDE